MSVRRMSATGCDGERRKDRLRRCQNQPVSVLTNHELFAVIVLLAEGLLEQEIRRFEHDFHAQSTPFRVGGLKSPLL